MNIKILAQRGDYQFLVKRDSTFYLVNIKEMSAKVATPFNSPDIFLKMGYFQDAVLTTKIEMQIREILSKQL